MVPTLTSTHIKDKMEITTHKIKHGLFMYAIRKVQAGKYEGKWLIHRNRRSTMHDKTASETFTNNGFQPTKSLTGIVLRFDTELKAANAISQYHEG